MNNPYFSVGYHKSEMDFSVSEAIGDLTYEEMRRLREMTIVGIGIYEGMWRRAQELKNMPQQGAKTNGESNG